MFNFSVDYVSSQILTVNPRSNYSQWIYDGHDGQAASGKPIILSLDPINPFHPIKCHADFCLISLMMLRIKIVDALSLCSLCSYVDGAVWNKG